MPSIDLQHALSRNGFELQDPLLTSLDHFIQLLQEWNEHINLTAHRDLVDIYEKDLVDSFFLARCIRDRASNFGTAIDLGCGAGFSGLVLALLNPQSTITFLDSNRKKINFIRQVVRELQLANCCFLNERAREERKASNAHYEVVFSRATWQAIRFIRYGANYVQNNGMLFLMSGMSQPVPSPEALAQQGLAVVNEFQYMIQPKSYERKIFIFQAKHFT